MQGRNNLGGTNIEEFIRGITQEAKAQGVVTAGDFVTFINDYSNTNQFTQKQIFAKGGYGYRGLRISATALSKNKVIIIHSNHISGDTNYSVNGIVCDIDGSNITTGTDTEILSKANNPGSFVFQVITLDESRVLILYGEKQNSAYRMGCVACQISNTTITTGTKYNMTNFIVNTFRGVLLDKDKVLVVGATSNNETLAVAVYTINGLTVSYTGNTQLSSTATSGNNMSVIALSNTKIFITHRLEETSTSAIKITGRVCTISGTTITNTTTKTLFTGYKYGTSVELIALNENEVFLSYSLNSDTSLHTMICNISENAITTGTDTQIISSNAYLHSCQKLNENNVFIVYESSGIYIMTCNISGTIITARSSIKVLSKLYTNNLQSALLDENNILLFYNYEDNNDLYAMVVNYITNLVKKITSSTEKISGIAITDGTEGQTVSVKVPNVT